MIKTTKNYREAGACPVENLASVRFWTYGPRDDKDELRRVFERNRVLYGFNKDRFTKHWGKHAFTFTTYRRFRCWVHKLPSCTLVVLTHKNKGTCYEFAEETGTPEQMSKDIIEFLEKLVEDTMTEDDKIKEID